jgi:geranylgeranyl diphosphate synthase, type I
MHTSTHTSTRASAEVTFDADLAAAVQRELTAFLAARETACAQIDRSVASAVRVLADFVLSGGKRLRPTFAWWGWRGAGGDPAGEQAPAVLRVVSALELVQAGALIHDDVMDSSTTRRGMPTVHVSFAEQHARRRWLGEPDRFGAATATLLGDYALLWADDMLRGAGLAPDALERAGAVWNAMRIELIAGQYLDVRAQASGDETDLTALRVARYKSAAYTVERPLHLGAAIIDASPELIAGYRRFGTDIGVAFQLRDDLLGVFGDPAVTGKPAGDDLREGKRTLLVALALRAADQRDMPAAEAVVRAALGKPDLTDDEIDAVRGALVELGAVEAMEQRIDALTESALAALRAAPVAEPAATRLADLAIAATRRNR